MPVQFPTLKCAPSTIVSKLASGPLADQTPTAVRSLMFDGVAITPATVAPGDLVLMQDLDDSLNLKVVTAQSIADLASSIGDVVGPAGATDEALARYDTGTGKLIQDSLVLLDDAGALTGLTGVDVTGSITVSGNVDGRDVSADGAILDGIEPGADITDETNVLASLDGATIPAITLAPTDKVLLQDVDDADNLGTVTAQAIADLAVSGVGPNLLINPTFEFFQRGTTTISPVDQDYVADRWYWGQVGVGVVTVLQDTDVPAGFSGHSISVDVTTADGAIAASDRYHIGQRVEGLNAIPIALGTAGAQQLSYTFWVKSPKTGIHCVYLRNSALNRSYVSEFTVAIADTWEFFEINLTGDTAGVWLIDNGIGIEAGFTLAAGTDFHGTNDTWEAANDLSTVNQVNAMDNAANFFKVFQPKFEVGANGTAFVPRSFDAEFLSCRRYFQNITSAVGVGAAVGILADLSIRHPGMRVAPTPTATAALNITDVVTGAFLQTSPAASAISQDSEGGRYRFPNFVGLTDHRLYLFDNVGGTLQLDAEL